MRYFVVSDVHGFYTELKVALDKNGFNINDNSHKLIVCGDLMDRGCEAEKLQSFIVELLRKDKVILVRGNHEDLVLEMIKNYHDYASDIIYTHHGHNRTIHTMLDLTGLDLYDAMFNPDAFIEKANQTPFIKDIIPKMVNYYETDNYIFVHGWIPLLINESPLEGCYKYNPNWRNVNEQDWAKARWLNGMDCAIAYGIIEPNKTIVCGHWHASFGHANYWRHSIKGDEKRKQLNCDGQEFGKDADHSPFYAQGIIAIDACTAASKTVNCIVIDD